MAMIRWSQTPQLRVINQRLPAATSAGIKSSLANGSSCFTATAVELVFGETATAEISFDIANERSIHAKQILLWGSVVQTPPGRRPLVFQFHRTALFLC